ncbi:CD99 antigen-like protein 2 isoform X2 [Xyrauchen texanus]|uniref:CD99 antigen-like protein 2 isoform X2 n=1 Tax=Xyrauchen texanus TaxID=154827 RepID=UPI00224214A9|nr:CD99 antigen-like protein 2 isoform X2 [Xyrauchen texanus]
MCLGISEDFNLADAFDDDLPSSTPAPKVDPAGGAGAAVKPTKLPVQTTTKNPVKPKPKQTEEISTDFFEPTVRPGLLPQTTAKHLQTSVSSRKVQPGLEDFNLEDALDPDNDIRGNGKNSGKSDKGIGGGGRDDGRPNSRGGTGGGEFTDNDLVDVGNDDTYKPDKGKGGRATGGSELDPADENNDDTMAETGTIAGIVSAVAMTLVGAVSSYISYQKKKFCFSIQQSLNADMVKADAPDAVVAQEPQVQQTLLQPPNAEPPTEENAV